MGNGDPLFHLSTAITELNANMRDLRSDVGELRGEVTTVRETVARMEGRQQGEVQTVDRSHRKRDQWIAFAAAAGVILGSIATVAAVAQPFS